MAKRRRDSLPNSHSRRLDDAVVLRNGVGVIDLREHDAGGIGRLEVLQELAEQPL